MIIGNREVLMRRAVLGLFFLIFIISISGCQTVKGVGGIGKGLADDAYGIWQVIKRADEWIKENYW